MVAGAIGFSVLVSLAAGIYPASRAAKLNPARIWAKQQLENFQLALGQYHLDTGGYPSTDQGLAALRVQPPIRRQASHSLVLMFSSIPPRTLARAPGDLFSYVYGF